MYLTLNLDNHQICNNLPVPLNCQANETRHPKESSVKSCFSKVEFWINASIDDISTGVHLNICCEPLNNKGCLHSNTASSTVGTSLYRITLLLLYISATVLKITQWISTLTNHTDASTRETATIFFYKGPNGCIVY